MNNLKLPLAALVASGGVFALLQLSRQVKHSDIQSLFIYQFESLILCALVIVLIRVIVGRKLELLSIGKFSAISRPIPFLGVRRGEGWIRVGSNFALIVTAATAIYMYFGYQGEIVTVQANEWLFALAVAIPLSALNAFSEELITRWSIVEAAHETSFEKFAPWVSALVFGAAHYFGIPGGPIGSVMAAFLGWLLSRSIQDTRGLGWAVGLHFIQDLVILTVALAISM